MIRRAAVFFPIPGTSVKVSSSLFRTARRSAAGERTDNRPTATAGPTPWAPRSSSKQSLSSRDGKP